MGSKYKAGVPELNLPALDPLVVGRRKNIEEQLKNILIFLCFQMPGIELNLGNSKVKFEDIVANGLSRFKLLLSG